ncbi:MAG: hypothetical protein LBD22_07810 [Spirochaetaceae bacterium]|nr:hypothetical protein [Spirochaetaceae bacterium]
MAVLPALTACATGGGVGGGSLSSSSNAKNSEVVVRRVDNNQLIRLRLYLDGKSQGTLKVGDTVVYKVRNGYHTLRVGFDDYHKSTEVAQFTSNNSVHVFSVTDTSIVLVNEEPVVADEFGPPLPLSNGNHSYIISGSPANDVPEYPVVTPKLENGSLIDNSVRAAFDKVTKGVKRGRRIAIINVDGDNIHEANFVLEELTLLSVNSPKNFFVIDRRVFDAYRAKNSIGAPSYENDFVLRYLGSLVQADYVISGRIDGPGDLRRLRVKALDVATGALVGDAAERL